MAVAVREEGKKVNSNINVTPMVDVMLVLLIIFMVITPMLQNKVDPAQLGSLVRDKLADKTDKTIYIRADARAQYRTVEDAIDDVRTAGVEEVGMLTQKKEANLTGGGQ